MGSCGKERIKAPRGQTSLGGDGETVVVADFALNVAICGSRLGYWDIRARLACGGRGEPGDQLNAKWLPFRSPQSLPDLFPSDRVRAR